MGVAGVTVALRVLDQESKLRAAIARDLAQLDAHTADLWMAHERLASDRDGARGALDQWATLRAEVRAKLVALGETIDAQLGSRGWIDSAPRADSTELRTYDAVRLALADFERRLAATARSIANSETDLEELNGGARRTWWEGDRAEWSRLVKASEWAFGQPTAAGVGRRALYLWYGLGLTSAVVGAFAGVALLGSWLGAPTAPLGCVCR